MTTPLIERQEITEVGSIPKVQKGLVPELEDMTKSTCARGMAKASKGKGVSFLSQ